MFQHHRDRSRMTLFAILAAALVGGCELTNDVLPPQGDCEINSNYEIDCRPDHDLPLQRD